MFTLRMYACALVLLITAATAAAQGIARSFEQLQVLVKPGDEVTVRDAQGVETRGRITSLTDSALALARDGTTSTFGEAEVATIRQTRGDSLKNGALWGAGITMGLAGAGLASVCGTDLDQTDGCGAILLVAIPVYGAMGAGIGVGLDALIRGPHVIFERPRSARLGLAPIAGAGRRGVRLAVVF
jgi:hypothetical protein